MDRDSREDARPRMKNEPPVSTCSEVPYTVSSLNQNIGSSAVASRRRTLHNRSRPSAHWRRLEAPRLHVRHPPRRRLRRDPGSPRRSALRRFVSRQSRDRPGPSRTSPGYPPTCPLGMTPPPSTRVPASIATFSSTYDPGSSTDLAPMTTLSSTMAEEMELLAPMETY